MNYDEFTTLDCSALYDFKNISVVIEHGHVTGLVDNKREEDNHEEAVGNF